MLILQGLSKVYVAEKKNYTLTIADVMDMLELSMFLSRIWTEDSIVY